MKIMSKRSVKRMDAHLELTKIHLLGCIRIMKGRYGTRRAVDHMEFLLSYIDDLIDDGKYVKSFYQQFRNPPNTPKSRRLGWHEKGESK
jgi:hypothetical protein